MRKFIYSALAIIGVVLTVWTTQYAYADRGYFAVGGEYMPLLLPVVSFAVDCLMMDGEGEE